MNLEERYQVCRGMVVTLADAIYNGQEWDKQAVAALLHMGDPSLDYAFPGEPPAALTDTDFFEALDRIFERAGI